MGAVKIPATNDIGPSFRSTVLVAGDPIAAEVIRGQGLTVIEVSTAQEAMATLWADPIITTVVSARSLPGGGGERLATMTTAALGRKIDVVVMPSAGSDPEGPSKVLASLLPRMPMNRQPPPSTELDSLFECLAVAAEHKDNETGQHNRRLGRYAGLLARTMGWAHQRCRIIELAASLHDIGKIGIPDSILFKPSPLTPEERARMEHHTIAGHQILSAATSPVLACAANIARHHHERWGGGGYPFNLRGTAIPLEARIVSLCDVYDALRSERPYKAGLSHQDAARALLEGDERTSPDHFDPDVLAAFRRIQQKFDDTFTLLTGG